MKNKLRLSGVLAIMAVAVIGNENLADGEKNRTNFRTSDDKEISSMVKVMIEERLSKIAQIRVILREKGIEKSRPETLRALIEYLGAIRATEATEEILSHITFQPIISRDRPIGPEDYPAVQALVRIGIPAARSVVKHVENEQDTMTLALYATVIRAVFGTKLAPQFVTIEGNDTPAMRNFCNKFLFISK
jgi:hypothetical protein